MPVNRSAVTRMAPMGVGQPGDCGRKHSNATSDPAATTPHGWAMLDWHRVRRLYWKMSGDLELGDMPGLEWCLSGPPALSALYSRLSEPWTKGRRMGVVGIPFRV
jgi:hypothetical protein